MTSIDYRNELYNNLANIMGRIYKTEFNIPSRVWMGIRSGVQVIEGGSETVMRG